MRNTMNVTLSMEIQLWKKYLKYCEENGYGVSKRIAILIKTDMEKSGKT